jgi:hypothetical protein
LEAKYSDYAKDYMNNMVAIEKLTMEMTDDIMLIKD